MTGKGWIGKTKNEFDNVGETLVNMRRGQIIPMEWLRDDKAVLGDTAWWESVIEFTKYTRDLAEEFEMDRQQGQERRIILCCEAAGMVPQLRNYTSKYHVPVYSGGGFDSLTAQHTISKHVAAYENVLLLHIGDYDKAGKDIYKALSENVKAFTSRLGGTVKPIRLAVTPEQIEELNLPYEYEDDDSKGKKVQAEAIDPKVLKRIVIDEIESNLDMELYAKNVERETKERDKLVQLSL
jgi:hypothetical protein